MIQFVTSIFFKWVGLKPPTREASKKHPHQQLSVRRQEAALAESTEPEAGVVGGETAMGGPGAPCVLGNMGVPKMVVPNNHGFSYEK